MFKGPNNAASGTLFRQKTSKGEVGFMAEMYKKKRMEDIKRGAQSVLQLEYLADTNWKSKYGPYTRSTPRPCKSIRLEPLGVTPTLSSFQSLPDSLDSVSLIGPSSTLTDCTRPLKSKATLSNVSTLSQASLSTVNDDTRCSVTNPLQLPPIHEDFEQNSVNARKLNIIHTYEKAIRENIQVDHLFDKSRPHDKSKMKTSSRTRSENGYPNRQRPKWTMTDFDSNNGIVSVMQFHDQSITVRRENSDPRPISRMGTTVMLKNTDKLLNPHVRTLNSDRGSTDEGRSRSGVNLSDLKDDLGSTYDADTENFDTSPAKDWIRNKTPLFQNTAKCDVRGSEVRRLWPNAHKHRDNNPSFEMGVFKGSYPTIVDEEYILTHLPVAHINLREKCESWLECCSPFIFHL